MQQDDHLRQPVDPTVTPGLCECRVPGDGKLIRAVPVKRGKAVGRE